MKTIISAAALAISLSTAALAQQPAPTTAGPAEIFTRLPAGTTVTNFYKQNVYDPSDNKIGDVDDVLIDKEGRITAMIIGVGGFLGMGEKDVAVPFSSVRASEKNNKWYLVLNTNKEALKTAPGVHLRQDQNNLDACCQIDDRQRRARDPGHIGRSGLHPRAAG